MREVIATGKTVELATEEACRQLGLEREEVSIEILEMPARRFFKTTPAKVRATADGAEAPVEKEKPAAPKQAAKKPEPKRPAPKKAEPAAAAATETAADSTAEKVEIASLPKLAAAVAYLTEVFEAMGAGELTIWAEKQGEAYIIKVEGKSVGVLIGHRGETMENLSYLASLVANRMEGDYLKLGLDVAGYRGKREKDLEALARRIGNKVAKSGRSYAMDTMNPYERRIIHTVIGDMEGLRSESKGEGTSRRVIVYSTAREFADTERKEDATPVAPKRTQLVDDAEGFALYGKIEL